jgi:diguanylate cyclase (GGDEF)-like protein/PAS domain S-box-containing protein
VTGKTEGKRGRRSVLIVDDDPDILAVLTTLLETEGYRVLRSRSSEEFFSLLARESPDVALVDYMLPGMNGLEIIKLARRIDRGVPLVAITGQGSEKLAAEIMRAGASDYISKPFGNSEVLDAVGRALERSRIGTISLCRDLASANRELLRRMNERDAILKSMADSLFSVDGKLRVLSWNPAAEDLTGVPTEEAVGRSMGDIFGGEFCREEHHLLGHPEEESFTGVESIFNRRGGETPLTVIKSAALLRDEGGRVTGLVVSMRDVSHRKELFSQLIEKELELAGAREELQYNETISKKNALLRQGMEELNRKVSELSLLNEAGKILTSKLDLGDLLNTIMSMAGDLFRAQAYSIRLLNEEENKLYIAAHYGLSEEYLGRGPIPPGKSVAGTVLLQRKPIHVPDAMSHQGLYKVDVARREGLKSLFCFPLIIRERCIGVMTLYHKSTHYYSDDEVQFLSTFASTVSIAVDNARLYEEQTRQAVSDGLTGLHNHKYFHDSLSVEVSRAERYDYKLSVIILDIDYFKKYNDAHGHQAGDVLLREISGILKSVARENDVVARYGGEEFVYLLHQASKSEAMLFARRLRKRISSHPFEGEYVLPEGKLTVSLGVASYPEDADSAQSIIHMADQALYRAKHEGRNKVRAFQAVG